MLGMLLNMHVNPKNVTVYKENMKEFLQLLHGCEAAADDKKSGPGAIECGAGFQAALSQAGRGSTNKFRNLLAKFDFNFDDSISGSFSAYWAYSRTSPDGDTDWDDLPIGSMMTVLTVSAKAVTAANLYMHTSQGTWTALVNA